ncbi:hypothetical protein LJC71_07825 [Desulfosarcina sp. OttesenSCG-928-A07]|nr:hypothetical protein [Desulfosarcina sp. OttesenSCG-928-G17]MDL2329633.1 hypothetical protein [Desulfosarcina sp. OttesenSCG-928-A07]
MTKRESKVMRSFQIRMITLLAQGKFDAIDLKNDLFVKWLVGYMADNGIPFQLTPLGAGVTRVIAAGRRCSHCHGKGFIPAAEKPRPHILEDIKAPAQEAHHKGCDGNFTCENGCSQGGICCGKSRVHAA